MEGLGPFRGGKGSGWRVEGLSTSVLVFEV